mmetsp:Transcript_39486/g.43682  ORF Transcript_39486/g.43682 Transcript_39486/m.43682 type:complete len:205 (-) Transcript_39486:177-791(-)
MDITGTYTRHPNENEWHRVNIGIDGYDTFEWKNDADESWILQQDGTNRTILKLGEDCPYYEDGERTVRIERNSKGEVLGLVFMDEMYLKDTITIAGIYQRHPVENDWHKVSITRESFVKEEYKWTTNNENDSWILRKGNNSNAFRLGPDCPYFEDGVEVILEIVNGNKIGLRFNGDLFIMDENSNYPSDDYNDDEPEIDLSEGF